MKIDLVVTRHSGLVDFLREIGLAADQVTVLKHATAKDVTGKHVCGVLPHSLSCLCETFTEIPLNLPVELRGVELNLEQVRQYAGETVTYQIRCLPKATEFAHACDGRVGWYNGDHPCCCGNCRA